MKLSRGTKGCYILQEPRILLGNFRTLEETAICTAPGAGAQHSLPEVPLFPWSCESTAVLTGPDGEQPSIPPSNNISEHLLLPDPMIGSAF